MTTRTTLIAEIGSNYNSDLGLARHLIDAASEVGAHGVKFQTIRKEKLIAPRVRLQDGWGDHPAWKGFATAELPDAWHHQLKAHADSKSLEFISTPFYLEAVALLEAVGIGRYKVASGDVTFLPLLAEIGKTGKPVLLSTGGSSLPEVETALDTLTRNGSGQVTLLHCVVSYPPQWDEMNLGAIGTLRERFGLPVGISDHSPGWLVPVAAVSMGCEVVEKHVTLDRAQAGPDHPFAMTMPEFAEMATQVGRLEQALGSGKKEPTPSELERRHRFRRGVYDPVTLEPVEGDEGLWLRPEHWRPF